MIDLPSDEGTTDRGSCPGSKAPSQMEGHQRPTPKEGSKGGMPVPSERGGSLSRKAARIPSLGLTATTAAGWEAGDVTTRERETPRENNEQDEPSWKARKKLKKS